ncbi:DUF354 domain-containing protein [Natrononativus amylolyticus]|uniref:DUF354 domain-containing protein n=1 Tax=Natrononativus amylolyticus TaxID=2963434 RepID=UPI0020CD6D71|nr:DUF354 domain-containing protein [Natrononativus amylolyticus]
MKLIVTIQHPGHVHFYKHAIRELESEGHEVHVVARDKEIAVDLLERYGIDHTVLAGESGTLAELAVVQATYEWRLLQYARRIDPDVITGIGGVAAAHVAKLTDARSVVFTDTEHATLINTITHPIADVVCTPTCYTKRIGSQQVTYPSYHELAYLHPDRFTPDPGVFDSMDVGPEDTIAVVRLNGWDSSHDIGATGLDDVSAVVRRLEDAGAEVLITSEIPLPDELERCRATVPPDEIHHLLAYTDLFLGEGATMASECANLGTPAVYVNSLTMGYTDELEEEYGLLYNFPEEGGQAAALEQAVEILEAPDGGPWEERHERLLADKVDTTNVILELLEDVAGARKPPAVITGERTAPAPQL